jgi:hypothetical protein
MKKIALVAMIASTIVGCGRIETGEVGVRTDFNKTIEMTELSPGWYGALLTSVSKYDIRETEISFVDMTPKAKDNLLLKDLDVSLFYKIDASKVAEMTTKYAGMSAATSYGSFFPSFTLVERTARGVIYDSVSKFDSMTMHTKRSELENLILTQTQENLDYSDKGVFTVTKIIIRNLSTDQALEESIRTKVRVENEITATRQQIELAKAEAERVRVEYEGVKKRNQLLNESITPQLIEYKKAIALEECGGRVGCTMIVGNVTPIINVSK